MASHSISPSVKMGGPEKHFARGICEMRDQNKRLFRGKTVGRELLGKTKVGIPGNRCWVICAALMTACRRGDLTIAASYWSRRTQSGLYSFIRAGSNPIRCPVNRVTK